MSSGPVINYKSFKAFSQRHLSGILKQEFIKAISNLQRKLAGNIHSVQVTGSSQDTLCFV